LRRLAQTALALALLLLIPIKALPAAAPPFHRGTNILGYDPVWHGRKAQFTVADLRRIREAGFDTVRINMQPFKVSLSGENRLNPVWLALMDQYVDAALASGFYVVIDYHDTDSACSNNFSECTPKLRAFWKQISGHYRSKSDHLIYELLNEPHAPLSDQTWNIEQVNLINLIRSTDSSRIIVVSPTGYCSLRKLEALALPHDPHLIVTFHYYSPEGFTKQFRADPSRGSSGYRAWGSALDQLRLKSDFDVVAAWSKAHHTPIFLGEFGVWDAVPTSYRSAYMKAVVDAAERRNFGWAQWQYSRDFSATDSKTGLWIPSVLRALRGNAIQ